MSGLFACVFCMRSFSRHDALKRHWTTCKCRRSQALDVPRVELKPKGRKIKACDYCRRLKRACNGISPCDPCRQHRQTCVYTRTQYSTATAETANGMRPRNKIPEAYTETEITRDASLHVKSSTDEKATMSSPGQFLPGGLEDDSRSDNVIPPRALTQQLRPSERYLRPSCLDITSLKQFKFLQRIANDVGIANTFECGTLHERWRASQTWQVQNTHTSIKYGSISWQDSWDMMNTKEYPSWAELDGLSHISGIYALPTVSELDYAEILWPCSGPIVEQCNGLSPPSLVSSCLDDEASRAISRCHEMVALMRDTILTSHRPDIISLSWTDSLETMCHEFFHNDQLQKFLDLFWAFWKPNWPTIHQVTFNKSTASLKLVMAMAVLGATLSVDERERSMAHLWFNPIEQLVFDDDLFFEAAALGWENIESQSVRRRHLETLLAAYCVVLYQTWEGSLESKQRIRRLRYSAIVYLARDIGFASASLSAVDTTSITAFDWQEFILRESLTRVFHYIFALDSAYAMFNRHPPRMVLNELVMGFTAPEDCFQARSAEECFVSLRTWKDGLGSHSRSTVASTLVAICTQKPSPEVSKAFEKMSVLDMFTLVAGLYSMSFTLENSIIYNEELARIQAGLDRWMELWPSPSRDQELVSTNNTFHNYSEPAVGFTRYAPEYWLFTRLMVQRMRSKERMSHAGPFSRFRCDSTDMGQLQALLQSFRV